MVLIVQIRDMTNERSVDNTFEVRCSEWRLLKWGHVLFKVGHISAFTWDRGTRYTLDSTSIIEEYFSQHKSDLNLLELLFFTQRML